MKLLNIPGNIGALRNWLSLFGSVELVEQFQVEQLNSRDILILPGGNVGGLHISLADAIRRAVGRGCRLVAVCGSFQSLFTDTDEDVHHSCLQLFFGHTSKLNHPRIGRFTVDCDWFSGTPYFNHSYGVSIANQTATGCSNTAYAIDSSGLCVAVRTDHILGVQFHPELSMGTFDQIFYQWLGAN
jgi:imidazoleglycerol phosphate synthase glutamine amidotransferase subunit HisH